MPLSLFVIYARLPFVGAFCRELFWIIVELLFLTIGLSTTDKLLCRRYIGKLEKRREVIALRFFVQPDAGVPMMRYVTSI